MYYLINVVYLDGHVYCDLRDRTKEASLVFSAISRCNAGTIEHTEAVLSLAVAFSDGNCVVYVAV